MELKSNITSLNVTPSIAFNRTAYGIEMLLCLLLLRLNSLLLIAPLMELK